MQKIYENLKEFWGGFVGGGFAGIGLSRIDGVAILKYLGGLGTVALSAIIGALFTALASDYYKHRIKNKLFKTKDNGKSEKDKAA